MKNLYIYLIAIFYFSAGIAQQIPQNQNANWLFGGSGLTFYSDPSNPTAISSSLNFSESCATVSDQNGNLLFSTNGSTVWNASNLTMLNGGGLLSDPSVTQGAVIIPRPGHNAFYIATIDGSTGSGRGIHYSEVDMSVGAGTVVLANKNTPLNDHNGNPFGNDYEVRSEKLTSTVHSNGVDYWLVAQIADKIYSYLVTSSGIALNPVVSDAPFDVLVDITVFGGPGMGQMKISPNTLRIGIAYNNMEWGIDELGWLALGDFDNTTGLADFDDELIEIDGDFNFYGIEFAPNSTFAYFTTQNNIQVESARGTTSTTSELYSNIYRVNALKTTTPKVPVLIEHRLVSTNTPQNTSLQSSTPITDLNGYLGLQLAINGRIYVSFHPAAAVSAINNPNDPLNPNFVADDIAVSGSVSSNFPQWVHNHTIELCDANITLSTAEPNQIHTYAFSDFINTNLNYSITTNQDITFEAGNFIQLDANTHISKGGQCLGIIQPCGEIIGSSTTSERPALNNYTATKAIENNDLILFPNPSNDIVNLYYQKGIKNITVIAIDGKAIYNTIVNGDTEYVLNVKNFSKGIYLINIESKEGEFFTKKLIVE